MPVEEDAAEDRAEDEAYAASRVEDAEEFALGGFIDGVAGEGVESGVGDALSAGVEEAGTKQADDDGKGKDVVDERHQGESDALEQEAAREKVAVGGVFGEHRENRALSGHADDGFKGEDRTEFSLAESPLVFDEATEGAFEAGEGEPGDGSEDDEGDEAGKLFEQGGEAKRAFVVDRFAAAEVGEEENHQDAIGGSGGADEADGRGSEMSGDKPADGGARDHTSHLGGSESAENSLAFVRMRLVGKACLGDGDVGTT